MSKINIVDNSFLMAETRETPIHVAALQIFKLPQGLEEQDRQDFFAETLETMGKLTAGKPLFNRRLQTSLMGLGNPSWVADDDFDLDYHMRHSSLPQPGSRTQLMTLVARLHGLLLDRTRPLWELHLIDGIENDQFAIYFKIHHALIDGVGGMKLMQNMLSKSSAAHTARPLGEKEVKGGKSQKAETSAGEALTRTAKLLSTLAPEMGRELLGYGRQRIIPDPEAARQWYESPDSPINVPISAQRRFAVNSFKLNDFKRVSKAKKATINDVIITICGGALRRYMLEHGNLPETSLIAGVPVSVRVKGQKGGNAFSMVMCDMGTDIEDPEARLKFVHGSTKKAKSHLNGLSREAITGMTIVMGAPLMGSQMLKAARHAPLPYNVLVSNIPGSKNKLYLNGAEMVGFYPVNLLYDMQALSITVTSYVDSLDFGLIACRKTIPDLNILTSYIASEFEKLEKG